jgi:hypothetical protein
VLPFSERINVRHCHRPKAPGRNNDRQQESLRSVGGARPLFQGIADLWGQLLSAAGRCQAIFDHLQGNSQRFVSLSLSLSLLGLYR